MKWEEFVNQNKLDLNQYPWTETNIECPKCGKYVYKNDGIVLCTYPPEYEYKCKKCGWTGTA